jgi:hypothetical protein
MKFLLVFSTVSVIAAAMHVTPCSADSSAKPGVYACYGQNGPAIPMQFGLIDGSTYSVYDGKTGKYVISSDVLSFVDGPLAGITYRHVTSSPIDVFRMLDQHGALTAYNCPWQAGDARRGHW